MTDHDPVNSPSHYAWHPSGIQPIEISEWCSFNIGTAINYIWRHAHKGQPVQDLRKAAWHLRREAVRVRDGGLINMPDSPCGGNVTLDMVVDSFESLVRRAFYEIWLVGSLSHEEFNIACLECAARYCEEEADRLESSK